VEAGSLAAPSVNAPPDGGEVDSETPLLSVNNASSPQGLPLTYAFEVYADAQLSRLEASVTGVQEGTRTTAWQVDTVLADDTRHYWRCRASDGGRVSSWMPTASFFVNRENDLPSAPTVSSPLDGSAVASLTPVLEVTNAGDPDGDPLVYAFEVYEDPEMTVRLRSAEGIIQGAGGTTSWTVTPALEEDLAWYGWRARARDDQGAFGEWSPLASFFTNVTGVHPPTAPTVRSPEDGSVVRTLFPLLVVNNAADPDRDPVVYLFEIDRVETFDSPALQSSDEVAEGPGATSWAVSQLEDNTTCFWRARAWDGSSSSPWMTGAAGEGPASFFVNLYNDPPVAQDDQATTDRATPVTIPLTANDTDPDGDEGIDPASVVVVQQPAHGSVRALEDGSALYTPDETFSATDTFTYTVRDMLGALSGEATVHIGNSYAVPTLNNPVSGGIVSTVQPTLSVNNVRYGGDDALRYEFELYQGQDLGQPVSSAIRPQGDALTSWTLEVNLSDNTTYAWRVRVTDGQIYSAWMPTALFTVNTAGADTTVDVQASQLVPADAEETVTVEVTDPESPILGAAVEIPPGALAQDTQITVGRVANPPALPADTVAVGPVIDFGPSGSVFQGALNLRFPYTQDDLDAAGVTEAAGLTVYTFDPSTLAWEPVEVSLVDPDASVLVLRAQHFSMYTTGVPVAPSTPSPGLQLEDDCSGCCFIATAQDEVTGPRSGEPADAALGLLSVLLLLAVGLAAALRAGRTQQDLTGR